MTAEEFLIIMWNKCICFKNIDFPKNIIMVYDPIYLRMKKLKSLNNSNEEIKFIKTNESKVLFHQDNTGFFDVSQTNIWLVLETEYGLKYHEIVKLIETTLLQDEKFKNFQIYPLPNSFNITLLENIDI